MVWLLGIFKTLGEWLIPVLIKDLIGFFQDWLAQKKSKKQKESQEAQSAESYTNIINKPDVTREEQSNAEDDLLNRNK